uniref:Uncharacterized protein n=1 Tax=Arundo donax TaxID=35708 RepID=A0A0A9A2K7_ARUDO
MEPAFLVLQCASIVFCYFIARRVEFQNRIFKISSVQ